MIEAAFCTVTMMLFFWLGYCMGRADQCLSQIKDSLKRVSGHVDDMRSNAAKVSESVRKIQAILKEVP